MPCVPNFVDLVSSFSFLLNTFYTYRTKINRNGIDVLLVIVTIMIVLSIYYRCYIFLSDPLFQRFSLYIYCIMQFIHSKFSSWYQELSLKSLVSSIGSVNGLPSFLFHSWVSKRTPSFELEAADWQSNHASSSENCCIFCATVSPTCDVHAPPSHYWFAMLPLPFNSLAYSGLFLPLPDGLHFCGLFRGFQ
jgi:hypothetical protein